MKKVYILYESDWDYYSLISVHRTRNGAEKAKRVYKKTWNRRGNHPDVDIQEMEVQD